MRWHGTSIQQVSAYREVCRVWFSLYLPRAKEVRNQAVDMFQAQGLLCFFFWDSADSVYSQKSKPLFKRSSKGYIKTKTKRKSHAEAHNEICIG
jgi:hypothetical protein